MPAMRKKERNGPGISTFADSVDPTLASSTDTESERLVPRAAAVKLEPTETATARSAARRKKELANRFAGKTFKRKVRTFKISSPKRSRTCTAQLRCAERRFGPKRNQVQNG